MHTMYSQCFFACQYSYNYNYDYNFPQDWDIYICSNETQQLYPNLI